jgi:hypothetical protein
MLRKGKKVQREKRGKHLPRDRRFKKTMILMKMKRKKKKVKGKTKMQVIILMMIPLQNLLL